MSPEQLLLLEAAKYGLLVLLLVAAVVFLVRHMQRQSRRWEARLDAAATQWREQMREAVAACERREAALVVRIQNVEDRQHREAADLLASAVDALATNARAFEKFADVETDSIRKDRK